MGGSRPFAPERCVIYLQTVANGAKAVVSSVLAALPRGRPVDDSTWRSRHRLIVVLLAAHVPGLAIYGLLRDVPPVHLVLEVLAVATFAAMAAIRGLPRSLAASAGTLGLVTSSALLVHFSDGLIEAHFHFFVMIGVITLYQSWIPFLLAVLYVAVHHSLVGILQPDSVFNHEPAIENPARWAAIHALFIGAASLAGLRAWKHAEVEREAAEAAAVRLYDREIRQREALELNDTVVQGLVIAKMASEFGDHEQAYAAIERTLEHAKSLVGSLMEADEVPQAGYLRRESAASIDA